MRRRLPLKMARPISPYMVAPPPIALGDILSHDLSCDVSRNYAPMRNPKHVFDICFNISQFQIQKMYRQTMF